MSEDLIRYKQSSRIRFQNASSESKYRDLQQRSGPDSSVLAFSVLFLLCLAYAYLEFRAFGHDVPIPMYGYLLAAGMALVNLLICRFSDEHHYLQMRLVSNGLLAMGTVIGAVFLQKYSAYHAIEFVLLVAWLASLRPLSMAVTLVMNLLLTLVFVAVIYITDVSSFWIVLVSILLASAVALGAYIGYQTERSRRMLFLQIDVNDNMTKRQEMWAYTLIDLDMALSGILDFKELITLLKKHLEPVIEFDSYVLTSLDGQGPKPVADEVEGELFENDDRTLWSEELLGKLSQTRQATVSSEHEAVKGFLGKQKQRFISYRLDIPVFSDSKMLGIVSLRRDTEPFDPLDMISSVSISSQAMLIFKRSTNTRNFASSQAAADTVIRPGQKLEAMQASISNPSAITDSNPTNPISSSEHNDMEMTDHSFTESDQTLVPKDVITQFKREQESVKKTITLISRENAEKVSIDRYRTAAVEGEPLSVLIVEVDGLSKLREKDGDQVAYKVFATIVKYIFSKTDKEKEILGRYGQNGLSVLMPQVDMNAAEKFAEMLRQFVEKARYKTAYGEKTATLSIGVAAITDDTGDYNSMVKRADMALFVAKKNGRNCVKVRL
ncbi:MAG: diguanylate cyclase [Gammaproteobacteria bacterium]|nr:diguanylate cyclase [Gammaproteobacteria bacterium]